MLSDGTNTYLYGLDRLATVNAAGRTWELHDALGSVRLHLDDAGTPLSASGLSYTPFGVPQSGALPQPFGFAGELHSGELLYLRARWYDAGSGTFTSVDPFEGWDTRPYSLHPYQYGYSDPIRYVDPSGRCIPEWIPGGEPGCQIMAGTIEERVQDGEAYLWDVFQGAGILGAVAVDTATRINPHWQDTHGTAHILNDASVGTYLGMTFMTIATGGRLAEMVEMEASLLQGMAWGSSIDILVQASQGDINWSQTYFNTLAGGLGGVLGGGVAAIPELHLGGKMLLNGVGSFGIGGLLTFLQNEATGSCYTTNDILLAAGINGGLGMFGSAIGDGVAALGAARRNRSIQAYLYNKFGSQYFGNRIRSYQTPRNSLDWSLLYKNQRSPLGNYMASVNQFVDHHPMVRWIALANSLGMAVSNSGVLVPPPPDE